jgi:hypothetical protein
MEHFGISPENREEYLAGVRAAIDLGRCIVLGPGESENVRFDWPRRGLPGQLFVMLSLPALLRSATISHSGFSTVPLRGEF